METPEQLEKKRKNRLELKRKLWTLALNILLAVLIIILIVTIGISKREFKQEGQVIEHTVRQGENLTQLANKYYEDEYLPKAISSIKKLNNMTESDIQVGQVLRIEVK